MFKPTSYKIQKNDKLDQVVKKLGHKDWRLIWKDKRNKAIVTKRKEPELLQPGDIIVIPPNEREMKQELEYIEQLQSGISAELDAEKVFLEAAARYPLMARRKLEHADEVAKAYRDMLSPIEAVASKARTVSESVDMTADVSLMFLSIGKIASVGYQKAAKESAELVKLNKKALGDAGAVLISPLSKVAQHYIVQETTNSKAALSEATMLAGEFLSAFGKLTKPSFWGTTMAKLIDGADWSTAVTADLSGDLKKRISALEVDRDKLIRKLKSEAANFQKRAVEMEKAAKHAAAFIKELRAELKARE